MVNQPTPVYRKDYKPTPFLVETVYLSFNLNDDVTRVSSKLHMVPNYDGGDVPDLVFNGRSDVSLVGVKVAGKEWPKDKYEVTPKFLTIKELPSGDFDVEIDVDIKPQENTILEGLYKSSGNYCSQVCSHYALPEHGNGCRLFLQYLNMCFLQGSVDERCQLLQWFFSC